MKIKNLKVTTTGIALGLALALTSPVDTYAEEYEVLYEETKEDEGRVKTEEIKETPEATNYEQEPVKKYEEPKKDPASLNGDCIDSDNYEVPEGHGYDLDGVKDEYDRKIGDQPKPTPTPKPTPDIPDTPETPTTPNTGTPVQLTTPVLPVAPKTGDSSLLLEIIEMLGMGGLPVIAGYSIDTYISKKKKNGKTK